MYRASKKKLLTYVAKVLIVVVWPLTLKMAALHINVCGSQWLLIINFFISHKY